jgi:hypothetical protein
MWAYYLAIERGTIRLDIVVYILMLPPSCLCPVDTADIPALLSSMIRRGKSDIVLILHPTLSQLDTVDRCFLRYSMCSDSQLTVAVRCALALTAGQALQELQSADDVVPAGHAIHPVKRPQM